MSASIHNFPTPANGNSAAPDAAAEPSVPASLINHDLIDSLETLLLNAKNGRISAMAWVTLEPSGVPDNGWGALILEENDLLLAGIVRLEREFEQETRAD